MGWKNKNEQQEWLWSHKTDSEKILILWQLIENSKTITKKQRDKVWAVLQGILYYTDKGEELLPHHRKYLKEQWNRAWKSQRDKKIKWDIANWLSEPPF